MRRTFGRFSSRGDSGAQTLNITSLMDMMTIILIFLLVHFSAEDQNLHLEKEVDLPRSSSENPFKWAINISVSQERLKVEDEFVCPIKDGRFVMAKGNDDRILPLYNRLLKLKELEGRRDVERDASEPVVIFHADKRHRFETIYAIMKTAAMAGYPNFRFAVLKN